MSEEHTTVALQRCLDSPPGDVLSDSAIRDVLGRSLNRLQVLCATQLGRDFPRLSRPPLNLDSAEMLGAVVERLHKALRKVRPKNVRIFFALANKHIRWELNDLARRLDEQKRAGRLPADLPGESESQDSQLSLDMRRILQAIEELPKREREVFSLVRIQGLPQSEVATLLEVSTKTVQRSLNTALLLLTAELADLQRNSDRPESR